MAVKVSADTITDLTRDHAFKSVAVPKQPTAQEMIDNIRKHLAEQIVILKAKADEARATETDPEAPPSPFEIAHARTIRYRDSFEQILANVPDGFRLTPVLYSKITQKHNARVHGEFGKEVRHAFMQYIAEHHADELLALGIRAEAIQQMKDGDEPRDENGNKYKINIDHIVERAGGGNMSLKRAVDPLLPAGSHATYLVNHFSNLILLPEHVHEFKNKLNDIQQAASTADGNCAWVLMMIPEVGPGQSGFVARPQKQGHLLHGILREGSKQPVSYEQLGKDVDSLRATINKFTNSGAVQFALRQRKGKAKDAFNRAVKDSPKLKKQLENNILPAIERIEAKLTPLFNQITHHKDNATRRSAIAFFQGKRMKALRDALNALPVDETQKLQRTLSSIDNKIASYKR